MPQAPDVVADRTGLAEVAAGVRAAAAEGAPLAVRGSGSWWTDAPADARALSIAGLDAVSDFDPADLVVTVGGGAPLDRLAARLAARGAWLPFDPPGSPARTVGGALASGGCGPLAAHYGPARDQVLGLTVVAGDGTVVRLGGRVVKNVAGFDLAKLVVGGHGAFGVIAEAHLRLRARPAVDRTAVWSGGAAWVERASAAALAEATSPAALEAVSPGLSAQLGWGQAWSLAARCVGPGAGVAEELEAVARSAGAPAPLALEGDGPWTPWREAVGRWPVVVRVGAEPGSWMRAVELAGRHLGNEEDLAFRLADHFPIKVIVHNGTPAEGRGPNDNQHGLAGFCRDRRFALFCDHVQFRAACAQE